MPMLLMSVATGQIYQEGSPIPDGTVLVPVEEAEPYYEQAVRSSSRPLGRSDDGRFDKTHLSPENAWRLGRDYLAHCLRYGWPMQVVRESVGPNAAILEMGCGAEIPLFRALTCDHSAVKFYKPRLYVAADLNDIKYRPEITGCRTVILPRTNLVDDPSRVPDEPFDLVISFEVLEHMDKSAGEIFLDNMVGFAARKAQAGGSDGLLLLSTPVNDGVGIAKNHIYEWRRSELERAFQRRGCEVVQQFGTFANLRDLVNALTSAEREVWNSMARYHSPHTLCAFFASNHPEAARNIAWRVRVPADAHGVA